MSNFQLNRDQKGKTSFSLRRTLQCQVALLLAVALLIVALPMHPGAYAQTKEGSNGGKAEQSLFWLVGLLLEADSLVKSEAVRSELKEVREAASRASKQDLATAPSISEMQLVRAKLRHLVDDPRGESNEFQQKIAIAQKAVEDFFAYVGMKNGLAVRTDTAFGLQTTTFDTLEGTVTVNLPDDLAAGDTISGTVIAETKKQTSPEENRAAGPTSADLNGFVVEIADHPTTSKVHDNNSAPPCSDPQQKQNDPSSICRNFYWDIPAGVSKIPLVLKNREGKIVSRAEVPVAPTPMRVVPNPFEGNVAKSVDFGTSPVGPKGNPAKTSDYLTPPFGQAGKPISVKGPFDGDFTSAKVILRNHPAKFLASSPRKVVVESPRDLNGVADIEIEYKGKTVARCTYRSISVKLSADKLNLLNGEQTTLTMTLAGLVGLLSPVSVQLSNKSPGTVSMAGGETQTINVSPENFEGDVFKTTRTLTGLKAGGFVINAVVDSSRSIQGNCDQGNGAGTPIYGPRPPDNPNGQPFPNPNPQPSPMPSDIDADGNPRTSNNGPSRPVNPFHGRFRVTLNGFRVNHWTYHGVLQHPDAVTFHPDVQIYDVSGGRRSFIQGGSTNTIGMTPSNPVQGGSASPNGGLQTGDGFPTQTTPWQRTVPYSTGAPGTIPPTLYFENELVQNTNAAVIIPDIWSIDGNDGLNLRESYFRELVRSRPEVGAAVISMISHPAGLELNNFLRPGSALGIRNTMSLGYGFPQNRPIGMQSIGRNQFGFTPQVLVLTYESADYISRTSFGFGRGIIPVRYADDSSLAADYTLYFQVERLDTMPPCAASITGSHFTGTAVLTTTREEAPGPYNSDIDLTVDFTDCRDTIRITNFPPLTSHSETRVGSNTSTMTMVSGGAGRFTSTNRSISMPITLGLHNSLGILGNSTLPLTLTGAIDPATGTATLRGTGTFSGGQLGTYQGTVVVTGTFSPAP